MPSLGKIGLGNGFGKDHGGGGKDHCGPGKDDDPKDDDDDQDNGSTKGNFPEIAKDTSGITFHVDYDNDGTVDDYYYVDADELDTKDAPTFQDYFDKASENIDVNKPGTDPTKTVIKATIYGPNNEESYYHFTGDEFEDDDSADDDDDKDDDCGGGKGHGGHGGKGHGGKDHGGKDHGGKGHGKGDDCDKDRGKHADKDDDKDDDKDGSKWGHKLGQKLTETKGAYWDKAGAFFDGLCTDKDDLPEDDASANEDEDEGETAEA